MLIPQRSQRFRRIGRAAMALKIADSHTRMPHHRSRRLHPVLKRCRTAIFQRIARRHQPKHAVQPKPFQRLARDMHMTRMWRIKRSPQQTHGHPRTQIWQPLSHRVQIERRHNEMSSQGAQKLGQMLAQLH